MIYGIGTDIIEVSRVRKAMETDPGFYKDIFTSEEVKYCESKVYKYRHYAARFCAKESFLKALGLGINSGIKLTDIEVFNDQPGKPFIRLTGTAKEFISDLGISKIHVTLSHLKEIAEATVIIEKEDENHSKQTESK